MALLQRQGWRSLCHLEPRTPESSVMHRRRSRTRARFMVLAWALVLAASSHGGAALAADTAARNDGYVTAAKDATNMRTICAPGDPADNIVVVFFVRGSGERAGDPRGDNNRLRNRYYPALARSLVTRGYRVSALEASYPATGLDEVFAGRPGEFLSSAIDFRRSIRNQLQRVIERCQSRAVLVAAYSQGGIALRGALNSLGARWRPSITHIDLMGDGSADRAADRFMRTGKTPRVFVVRRPSRGIYSFSWALQDTGVTAPLEAAFNLWATSDIPKLQRLFAYPTFLQQRTDRYCADQDLVCDFDTFLDSYKSLQSSNAGLRRALYKNAASAHGSYPWRTIALDTAALFPSRPRTSGGPVGTTPGGQVPPVIPAPEQSPPAAEGPVEIGSGLPRATGTRVLAVAPSSPEILYAGTDAAGVYLSFIPVATGDRRVRGSRVGHSFIRWPSIRRTRSPSSRARARACTGRRMAEGGGRTAPMVSPGPMPREATALRPRRSWASR